MKQRQLWRQKELLWNADFSWLFRRVLLRTNSSYIHPGITAKLGDVRRLSSWFSAYNLLWKQSRLYGTILGRMYTLSDKCCQERVSLSGRKVMKRVKKQKWNLSCELCSNPRLKFYKIHWRIVQRIGDINSHFHQSSRPFGVFTDIDRTICNDSYTVPSFHSLIHFR